MGFVKRFIAGLLKIITLITFQLIGVGILAGLLFGFDYCYGKQVKRFTNSNKQELKRMAISRQECNQQIAFEITKYVMTHPDVRFHQALQNLNIEIPNTDQFYEESLETLKRIHNENQRAP